MSSRNKRSGHEDEHPDERWLVSYSDMITVLMILFIMLYAMSSVNVSKYKALKSSTAEALGSDPEGINDPQGPEELAAQKKSKSKDRDETAEEVAAAVQKELVKAGLAKEVSVTGEDRGVVMRFSDRVLFTTASAKLTGHGSKVLNKTLPALDVTTHPLTIEGHTDNRPIRTAQYPSNWELSTARSAAVLHHLQDAGIPAKRLSAAGYADTRPRKSNKSATGRQHNRRVEIVIHAPDKTTAAPAKSTTRTTAPAAKTKSHAGGH